MTRKFEVSLALILIGSSLAFGGVQPIGYSLAEILIFLIVILFLWNQKRQGQIDLSLPVWPLLFVLWTGLQLIPLPLSLLSKVSPAHRVTAAWLAANHVSSWGALSIYPEATLLGFFKVLAYLGVFVLAVHLFDSGRRKSFLVLALVCLGCFEAGYGIIQHLLSWNKIFGVTDPYDLWVAIGTYINRNHFAGLIELTFPFVFASAFYSYRVWSDPMHGATSSRSGSDGNSSIGFRVIFYLFLVAMMVVAVVFSFSRGGILAVSITLIALSVLTFLKVQRKSWGFVIAGVATLAVGFSLWIGIGTVTHRFVDMNQQEYTGTMWRTMMWSDTVNLIRANPILGTGLGTFGEAFRPFQMQLVNLHIDHAHNDYLEFASETGIIGFSLLFLPIFYLLIRMVISFLKDHRRYRSAILLGCIGSTLGLLIHSLTDFNLQVPANAMIFALILGIGYKAACLEPQKEPQEHPTTAH
jgi:O-antigen ligase